MYTVLMSCEREGERRREREREKERVREREGGGGRRKEGQREEDKETVLEDGLLTNKNSSHSSRAFFPTTQKKIERNSP